MNALNPKVPIPKLRPLEVYRILPQREELLRGVLSRNPRGRKQK